MTVANLHHLDNIDADANWLGHVLWFTISEANVSRQQLVNLFQTYGVDEEYLPAQIQKLDAWKRATSDRVMDEYTAANGNQVRILVRDMSNDPELVVRHVIREEVDSAGKRLEYGNGEVAICGFERPGAMAGTRDGFAKWELLDWRVPADEIPKIQDILDYMEMRYDRAVKLYDSQAVRNMVRRFIVSQRAIAVRPSGGVYFVHGAHTAELAKIQKVVKGLPGGSTLHALPLVDDVEQRAMLADAYAQEVKKEVEDLLRDIAEAAKRYEGKSVPKRTTESLSARLADALDRAKEHSERLNLVSAESHAGLDAAMDALTQLYRAVAA